MCVCVCVRARVFDCRNAWECKRNAWSGDGCVKKKWVLAYWLVILEWKYKERLCLLLFALRHITFPEHGLPGSTHNLPCPLSFQYVWSVRSSRCRLRAGRSQRYLGPRPALRSPAMAVSRWPGFRACQSVSRLLTGGGRRRCRVMGWARCRFRRAFGQVRPCF